MKVFLQEQYWKLTEKGNNLRPCDGRSVHLTLLEDLTYHSLEDPQVHNDILITQHGAIIMLQT